MLGPELLVKMRGIVEAKKAAIAAADALHATADSRVREAVSKINNRSSISCLLFDKLN